MAVAVGGVGPVRLAVVVASVAVLAACGGSDPEAEDQAAPAVADDDAAEPAADDEGADPPAEDGAAEPSADDGAAAEVDDGAEAAEPDDVTDPDERDSETDPLFGDRAEPWTAGADGALPADFVLPPTRLSESSGSDHLDYLDMLYDACELENMGACDALRLVAPLAGEHHEFGEDCGGRREPDGAIFQDCRRHRPTDGYTANAGAQITDEASAAAWWDDRQLHDPVLIAEFCRGFDFFREDARRYDGFRLVFLRVEEEVEGLDLDRDHRVDFERFAADRCEPER